MPFGLSRCVLLDLWLALCYATVSLSVPGAVPGRWCELTSLCWKTLLLIREAQLVLLLERVAVAVAVLSETPKNVWIAERKEQVKVTAAL